MHSCPSQGRADAVLSRLRRSDSCCLSLTPAGTQVTDSTVPRGDSSSRMPSGPGTINPVGTIFSQHSGEGGTTAPSFTGTWLPVPRDGGLSSGTQAISQGQDKARHENSAHGLHLLLPSLQEGPDGPARTAHHAAKEVS